jgi:hypothetical protein
MSDIGKVEQEILWRTARVRVLPYPKGQREEVGRFLQALSERAGQRALPADSSNRLNQPAAAVVGQRTLGLPAPLAMATLAIRFRKERLDVDLFRQEKGSTELLFSGGGRRPTLRELEKRTRR